MRIKVKTEVGTILYVPVDPDDSIATIKLKIRDKTSIDVEKQTLLIHGRPLNDSSSIDDILKNENLNLGHVRSSRRSIKKEMRRPSRLAIKDKNLKPCTICRHGTVTATIQKQYESTSFRSERYFLSCLYCMDHGPRNEASTYASLILALVSVVTGVVFGIFLQPVGYQQVKRTELEAVFYYVNLIAWIMRYHCQLFLNRSRMSTLGFNMDFWYLQFLSSSANLIKAGSFIWGYTALQRIDDKVPFRDIEALVSAINGISLTLLIIFQGLIFDRGIVPSILVGMIICCCFVLSVIYLSLYISLWKYPSDQVIANWVHMVWFADIVSSIIRYFPVIWENFYNKSFRGVDLGFLALEFIGGLALALSILFKPGCTPVASWRCCLHGINSDIATFVLGSAVAFLSFLTYLQYFGYHTNNVADDYLLEVVSEDDLMGRLPDVEMAASKPIRVAFLTASPGDDDEYDSLDWECYHCSNVQLLTCSTCASCGLSSAESQHLSKLHWIFE